LYIPTGGVFPKSRRLLNEAKGVDIEAKKKRKAVLPMDVPTKHMNFKPSIASSSVSSQGLVLVS
jgi:hypothetical protein